MGTSRREFVKLGAAVAVGALLPKAKGSESLEQAAPPAPPFSGDGLRLLSFAPRSGGPIRTGALRSSGRIVDIGETARRRGAALSFDPAQMISLVAAGETAKAEIRALISGDSDEGLRVAEVRLAAPIPVPARNVYAVGWNYLEHFLEGKAFRDASAAQSIPAHPVFFTKGTHCVNGPYDPIPFDPAVSTMIDWEGELAVIIGKRGRNIREDQALGHVFGYCVINDTTARDIQQKKHGGQWFKGKSLDGHGPLGPWIVTADGIDPDNLHLVTRVNGVVKQDARTSQMYFKVPRIISELSLGLTLEAGDIIATGTPPGVGYTRKPAEFLKPGDVMETEISGIGTIRNPIQAV